MGQKRLDSLSDYIRHQLGCLVTCQNCGHRAKLDPMAIRLTACDHHRSANIRDVARRLKCDQCGERQAIIEPSLMID